MGKLLGSGPKKQDLRPDPEIERRRQAEQAKAEAEAKAELEKQKEEELLLSTSSARASTLFSNGRLGFARSLLGGSKLL
jgi:hypothetical protein